MKNKTMFVNDNTTMIIPKENYQKQIFPIQSNNENDLLGRNVLSELISAIKDDRINTKRAILADIENNTRLQNRTDRIIATYERELQKNDLSEKRRNEILRYMRKIAETALHESNTSRDFQKEQLGYSHMLPMELISGIVIVVSIGAVSFALRHCIKK